MITKISKLKNFGIFQNYTIDGTLEPFKKYNLFYGWNGCGKSTLAHLFRNLERKELSKRYVGSEFEIDTEYGVIRHDNIEQNTLNIMVFNKEFVEKNVIWDDHVEGIIYISETKGNEKEQLDKKKDELKGKEKEIKKIDELLNDNPINKKIKGLITENESFLSDASKRIKGYFAVIEVNDSRLINYDKRKLSTFIDANIENIKLKKSKLTVAEIESLSKSIKPQEKSKIEVENLKKIDVSLFEIFYQQVIQLKNSIILSKSIDHLKENPTISKWVYQGLKEIHTEPYEKCEFCGQSLPKNRIEDLNKHFSNEFILLKEELTKEINWINENIISTEIPHISQLYDELKPEYEVATKEYFSIIDSINNVFNQWIKILELKLENPFFINDQITPKIIDEIILSYNICHDKFLNILFKHNEKLTNLDTEVKAAKEKLELHYVSEEVSKNNFIEKKEKEALAKELYEKFDKEITELKLEISTLKKNLASEGLGATEFNTKLHKFLGRNDLSLETRKEGGYKIMRYFSNEAYYLSEGEKSAIGLVYFITKLIEDENKIEDTIIVIDDPISSFDSNHLFAARSFIISNCENAKQLFIFTHNFWFFKLCRDWMKNKFVFVKDEQGNKLKDAKGYDQKKAIFQFYQINNYNEEGIRRSTLTNAGKELSQYDSEYHYLFSRLQYYNRLVELKIDDCYNLANVIRRVCEAALTFKYPQIRDIGGLINAATSFDREKKDRIYQFLNKYSHLDRIETIENLIENRQGESKAVLNDFIELLESELHEHYKNMCQTVRLN